MVRIFIAVALFLHTSQLFAQNAKARPNIIYIMSDDHAYQAISAYGHGLNHTPNIDKLAEQGVVFNRAFVTNSICGPSRAVMLTGKHSHIMVLRIITARSMVASKPSPNCCTMAVIPPRLLANGI